MKPATEPRPAHCAYVAHLRRCREAGVGRLCRTCLDLLRDADAESWRRVTRLTEAVGA